jgi:hypothetical protein
MTMRVREVDSTLRTSVSADDHSVSWRVKCLNCGAALAGPFCAECGQRALPPHPTVRDLVGDAIAEFSGWDGKFATTIRTLLGTPGELTRQWLDGRRVHFISPLRLYLTASLVYFVFAAAAPAVLKPKNATVSVAGIDIGPGDRNRASTKAPSAPERASAAASKGLTSGKGLTGAERDSALKAVARAPWLIRPMLTKAIDDPQAIKTGILRWMPRMLFALIPIYAGILALFYRRRHYPEHLYFAIHLHAFVFIALAVVDLVKFANIVVLAGIAQLAVSVWIVAYSVMALKRVYGGSTILNVAKGAGIMVLYCLLALPALVAVVFLSAF